ncbi:MAG TPA: hypothetical protein DCF33_14175 [Saprospirales bacterium]|nr:hypothetical protein [Saprospirales bacterium]
MKKQKFKTKLLLFQELGITKSTFYRLVNQKKLKISRSLITPKEENELRIALGFPPLPKFRSDLGQDGTKRVMYVRLPLA